jgi:protein-tyrosine phosphatase
MGEIFQMIDIHSHILPKLDDGAKTIEESIQMCRISYQDGIRTIVATPHILPGIYKNDRSAILAKLQELDRAIKQLGVGNSELIVKDSKSRSSSFSLNNSELETHNSELPLRVLPGADVHFSFDMHQRYERGEIVTVNDQGRYLMVEFAFQGIPYQAEEVLFQLLTEGIIPIISHPERNMEIGQRPKRYYEMIRMGCLGQVTAMSLTGGFGSGVKRIAETLLLKRLVHIIASDAHSPDGRPPVLSAGVRVAEKVIGREEARKMVTEYPQAVLEGRRPETPEPLSP